MATVVFNGVGLGVCVHGVSIIVVGSDVRIIMSDKLTNIDYFTQQKVLNSFLKREELEGVFTVPSEQDEAKR